MRRLGIVGAWAVLACTPDASPEPPMPDTGADEGADTLALDESDDGPSSCFVLPQCDPLAPACDGSELCIPTDAEFTCVPTVEGTEQVGLGEPCAGALSCQQGLACLSLTLTGCTGAPGCCVAFCDLTAPDCSDGLSCEPYDTNPSPSCYDDVGVCVET